MDTSEYLKDIVSIKKVLNNWSRIIDSLYKKAKEAEKKIVSIPNDTLRRRAEQEVAEQEVAEKTTQTDDTCHEQLSVGQVEHVSVPKVTHIYSSEQINNNELPKNDTSLDNKARNNEPLALTMDASLERKMSNKNPTDLSENSDEPKIVKDTMEVPSVNPASDIVVLSNKKITIPTEFKDTKKNSEKNNKMNVSNNENLRTVEQNEVITINDKTTIGDDNIMNNIIISSQNYKEFLNNFSLSAVKLYKSGKCNTKEDLNRLSRIIDEIIMLFLNRDSSAQINIDETSSDNQSNDNNKNAEIEINLQAIKQESKDVYDDNNTTVVSEVVNRAEINTVPEEQIEVSQIEKVLQDKQPQQKTNVKYNDFEQYNSYMMQNKNSHTLTKETRSPRPPSTTPRLQQYQPYNNQNSYSNQESTNKNIRYTYKRNNRQTPYPRCPQQMNQAQIQQLAQNHQAYTQYPQFVHQQNTPMQAQMQGMYSHNALYH